MFATWNTALLEAASKTLNQAGVFWEIRQCPRLEFAYAPEYPELWVQESSLWEMPDSRLSAAARPRRC